MREASGVEGQSEMRITIIYFEGYPELQADLSAFPLRARAERMRMLASLGLSVLSGGNVINKAQVVTQTNVTNHEAGLAASPNGPSVIAKNVFDQV